MPGPPSEGIAEPSGGRNAGEANGTDADSVASNADTGLFSDASGANSGVSGGGEAGTVHSRLLNAANIGDSTWVSECAARTPAARTPPSSASGIGPLASNSTNSPTFDALVAPSGPSFRFNDGAGDMDAQNAYSDSKGSSAVAHNTFLESVVSSESAEPSISSMRPNSTTEEHSKRFKRFGRPVERTMEPTVAATNVEPGVGTTTDPPLDSAAVSVEPTVFPETEELPVIRRLRSEDAPPMEWRREALVCYAEGHLDQFRLILEATMEVDWGPRRFSGQERAATMHMLAAYYVSRAFIPPKPSEAEGQNFLAKAQRLLEQADETDNNFGSASGLDAFICRGFHALAQHMVRHGEGDDLKRAEILFDAALKLDSASPRVILGKALVFTHHKEWTKALTCFRQVLRRAALPAPRAGSRIRSLRQLKFAMAVCFCGLGRFEQMRTALSGVVAADPGEVESLCALAHLEAKVSKDGVGKSMTYLDEAIKADRNHPVVMCQLANHAFYCGLEQQDGNNGVPPWELAKDLLSKALATTKSAEVRAEVHYQLGRLNHAQGLYTEAYEEYSKCRKLQPEHFACVYGFAQTCVQQQKLEEAASVLEAMRQSRGDMPEVLKLLAFAYLMHGKNPQKAVACADAYVANNKDDVEGWAMRAEAHDQLAAQQPNIAAPKVGIEAYEHVARLLEDKDGVKRHASPQMWNNLGTLRGLQGDPVGAKEAYNRGLELAERRLEGEGGGPSNAEEAKDLHIARLTMRFNRAWLSENLGEQPDYIQATQDYMAINEEHNWYADTLLQLGAQWQRMGKVEIAVQRYEEAMKQNPVLAALMQAEAYRQRADYPKALQSAETAVRCAGEKQFHYAHVFLGNLYFEVAISATTKQKDRDAKMCKALRNFTRALENEKDSHYAANGIGMVFAQRGKLDFARRTFQSVMQHHAMSGDPSVYINLAHTYLNSGGDDVRKAIALYERAKKLKPNDLTIRLYLAKAHFGMKEFERCSGVLSDATQIWPDDLLLRYNLAVSLESFGVYLVSMEKKTKRVVGVDSGMDQMMHAVELLSSASRLYEYVHLWWAAMSDEERKQLGAASGSPANLAEEMQRVNLHKDYCADITEKAKEELEQLMKLRADMEVRMKKISEDKEIQQKQKREREDEDTKKDAERNQEMEDQALRLMDSTREIDLGKNLEKFKDDKTALKKDAKMPKEKKLNPDVVHMEKRAPEHLALTEGALDGQDLLTSERSPTKIKERGDKKKKDKKEKDKHKKKEKKEKKKDKKEKRHKLKQSDEEEILEEEALEDESMEDNNNNEGAAGPGDDEQGAHSSEVVSELVKKKKKKKDGKEKKDKKKKEKDDKKHQKDAKRRKLHDGSSDDADGDKENVQAPVRTEDDMAMEEELFGPDD